MIRDAKNWHTLTVEQVIELTESPLDQGLSNEQVARRREQFGPNVVTVRGGPGAFVRFLLQFHQPLIYILIASGLITFALKEWVDSSVIFGVVLMNAVIGFIQESKALAAIEALAKTLTTEASVIRGGRQLRVPSPDLVPGDIVLLQSGDKVPADMRLVSLRDLQIAEAALTGESIPVEKALGVLPLDTVLADRKNMTYASTLVTYGTAKGVVIATGDQTEVGRISELIASVEDLQTPLTRRIAHFSRVLLWLILALAAVNFAIGLARGQSAVAMFIASVALAVAAIPEGLPAAVTITLAIGVARMARRQAIVRKLPAVETLGSTTVICSDKTGTLTENEMTVTAIVAGDDRFAVLGVGYAPKGEIRIVTVDDQPGWRDGRASTHFSVGDLHGRIALLECLRAGLLCNDSQLMQIGDRWEIQGDPTEGALVVVAAKAGMEAAVLREEWPRVDGIPFESEHQYMATLHDRGPAMARTAYIKGSVESVLQRCGSALDSGGRRQRLDADRVHADVAELASDGLRVLAFAVLQLPPETASLTHADVAGDLVFVGLQAMIDPPRPEVVASVKACQSAGICVKMITGDHALTAAAIAKQIGIDGASTSATSHVRVATGRELAQLSDNELSSCADQTSVFARVAPEQKLRLVRALQARGHVVAMTGDGVNDAPALKQADIGVAMGRAGTDVAKEAAAMVLTDDNFATIKAAVEEGRGVFDNLTKFIVWTLPTNIGEGLVVLAAVVAGVDLPISPVQILWINMNTAVLLGLMLAFEPKEPRIMERQPRDPHAPLLSRPLLMRIGLVSALLLFGAFGMFEWMEEMRGSSLEEARTVAVNVFVFGELFYLFNCRSLTQSMFHIGIFSNPAAIGGVVSMIGLQLLFTYSPPMNHLFHSVPIGADAWAMIIGFGLVVYFVIEVEKHFRGYTLQGRTRQMTSLTPFDRSTPSRKVIGK